MIFRALSSGLISALFGAFAHAANDPLETVRPEVPPVGITEWDYAFLRGLYRASYSQVNQQRDIAARMVRELAPR
ncbi:MAG TPA: hypothetical protein VFO82_06935 [Steroidobacteraceae bacterium]|nr:hypothetical protein [Steroidobacteraceae bacterium]